MLIDNIALGFETAFSVQNLLYAFFGCLLGTLIGVLPGLGPLATIAMLLPFTYGLDPTSALIMLAGIYYGSQYGGSTTAILVNMPGEVSSVVSMIDGHKMAVQGRAGVALFTAAMGSFIAGTFGALILAVFSMPLSSIILNFGAAEYFSLMVVGLLCAVVMSSASLPQAIGLTAIGLLIGLVGTDINSGVLRYTFGAAGLWDGIDIIVLAVGMFAISEVVFSLEEKQSTSVVNAKITSIWPKREDYRRALPAVGRGTFLGSIIGVLPGAGLPVSTFLAYALEKKISKTPEQFGRGAIEGLAGPESANNAAAQTSFVPTLLLGIPGSGTMALMLGAMMIHNIQPGPKVMTSNPELFWGLIASMWIGNVMLVILNLPLVGLWVKLLKIPYRLMYPAILMFCCIGVYSVQNSAFDVLLCVGFGFFGYTLRKLGCEPAPIVLGLVLGPMMEESFRRALLLSGGDYAVFIERPISAGLLIFAAIGVALIAFSSFGKRNRALRAAVANATTETHP